DVRRVGAFREKLKDPGRGLWPAANLLAGRRSSRGQKTGRSKPSAWGGGPLFRAPQTKPGPNADSLGGGRPISPPILKGVPPSALPLQAGLPARLPPQAEVLASVVGQQHCPRTAVTLEQGPDQPLFVRPRVGINHIKVSRDK